MESRPLLIVDGANVVGSRPDGWWRDRAGAAVVSAPGSGDDTMVELVAAAPDRRRVVVTADRELRERVAALGAEVRGPRWLGR